MPATWEAADEGEGEEEELGDEEQEQGEDQEQKSQEAAEHGSTVKELVQRRRIPLDSPHEGHSKQPSAGSSASTVVTAEG